MKKRNFKSVALATVLAAGLSVAGSASAAEARIIHDPCSNCGSSNWFFPADAETVYYEELSHFNHRKHISIDKQCNGCGKWETDGEVVYEDHTLVNAPYDSGHTYECLYCEYYE